MKALLTAATGATLLDCAALSILIAPGYVAEANPVTRALLGVSLAAALSVRLAALLFLLVVASRYPITSMKVAAGLYTLVGLVGIVSTVASARWAL